MENTIRSVIIAISIIPLLKLNLQIEDGATSTILLCHVLVVN